MSSIYSQSHLSSYMGHDDTGHITKGDAPRSDNAHNFWNYGLDKYALEGLKAEGLTQNYPCEVAEDCSDAREMFDAMCRPCKG